MTSKIIVGPINKGLKTNRLPFIIDNDSFPTLINAYQWRGRVKRKRGTSLLGRLQRFLGTTDGSGNLTVTINPVPIATGITSFNVIGLTQTDIFTDPGGSSPVTLLKSNASSSGTLDRVAGTLTITGSQLNSPVVYFPSLPVMGLEDLNLNATQFPGTLGFDTDFSYNIPTTFPYTPYDVSFYKNPAANGVTLPGYVPKSTPTPTSWNGADYQQFWTTNYESALWATNGIDIGPTTLNTIGMQFAGPATTPALSAATRNSPTTMSFTITGNPLVVGDFVFANEFSASAGGSAQAINFQTGYVTTQGNTFTVTFPFANIPAGTYTPGILQYLTNRSNTALDCLRWYDGDPTNGLLPPSFVQGNGWVNFAPPLNFLTANPTFSIDDNIPAQYYLVGARTILPFKDRLLFFGPVIQSSGGNKVYLQDTVIFSQNGTPYYTASFTGDPRTVITFNPILVPAGETAAPNAWWEDQTGFGGFLSAGIDQPILTTAPNEDVLIVGFNNLQSRLVYSGNDIIPFNFFLINSELGSGSTFSSIIMDKGILTRGGRGFIITSQVETRRFDIEIPDQIFEISLLNNGTERVTAQRDFINEWIYFTYPSNEVTYKFPNQTLLYNYRDDSFAIFNETYTTYGAFRKASGLTWANVGKIYPRWGSWNVPWNAGATTLMQPDVIAGNQQGFVLFRETGSTNEGNSLTIQAITGNTITAPNHCLNDGDYIVISGALGAIGSQINGKIFSVQLPTTNTFMLNLAINSTGTDYNGGGLIQRMYVPFIQTKQFPLTWEMARKTRLGPQQYLFTTTPKGQVTLLIFLSQNAVGDPQAAFNLGTIVPDVNSVNNSLIYSTILYTCPESTNLGLLPASTNMANPANVSQVMNTVTGTAGQPVSILQDQTWHRMNTSLIGDTIQVGFTLSDTQMRDTNFNSQFEEIEFHAMILDVSKAQVLA